MPMPHHPSASGTETVLMFDRNGERFFFLSMASR